MRPGGPAPTRGLTVWFTGLPGSGKTTTAEALIDELTRKSVPAELLDGDSLRSDVSADLGYSRRDRARHAQRVGAMALELAAEGTVAVAAIVSPFAADRHEIRLRHAGLGLTFIEVWVATPLHVCEARDPKGLYRRARQGLLCHMTGIDQPYEAPTEPELEINTESRSSDELVAPIVSSVMAAVAGDRK